MTASSTRRLRLLLLAPIVAALAAPALAAAAPAPVAITACRGGITSVELMEIAAYDVTFRNEARVAADEIRFGARYGRHEKRATFDVKGTFAPGVDVRRSVRRTVSGGLFSYTSDQNDCAVEYVHFTDGTSWSASGATAPRRSDARRRHNRPQAA